MRISDWSSDVCSSDLAGKLDHAIALAQPVLRADAAADLGHGGGAVGQLIGFAQPAFGRQLQPVGDMVAERAMDRAIGHAALRAARRLFLRLRQNELARDFQKIIVAFPGGAFLGIALSGPDQRAEERREGKEYVSKCRSRCWPDDIKNKKKEIIH